MSRFTPASWASATACTCCRWCFARSTTSSALGRTQELRDAAKRADRYLKELRRRGDLRAGVKVAGDVTAVFEYTEPKADGLPTWLDLDVPDDRLVASVLLLQSGHPGSVVYVATSDLNLQNKLGATGLPYIEPPDS